MTTPASMYGAITYGTSLYGAQGGNLPSAYLVEPFVARSVSYTSIGVSWVKPSATNIVRWRLLSNRYGYPVDQNDGNIVIDATTYPGSYYLDSSVIPGTYHYYGLYGQTNASTNQWQRLGVTACLAVKSFGTGSWLQSNLPAYFTENLQGDLTTDAAGNSFLTQFLSVLGYGIDYLKTQYAMSAQHLNDPMSIPIGDLVNLAAEVGLSFDPMVSVYLMRKAVLNWAYTCQQRGTPAGLAAELTLSTGLNVDLQTGPNLLLEDDQAHHYHPVYPPYDPSINYALGERVSYGSYWYSCALANTKGTAPTGAATSNANWTVIQDNDEGTGVLLNKTTGWMNTWEPLYPGVSNAAANSGYNAGTGVFTAASSALTQGIGVPDPLNSGTWNFNCLRVVNRGAAAQDVIVRSVSRTLADMATTTTDWHPDPAQAIKDGTPVPFTLPTQVWSATKRYATGSIVTYNGLPFLARRASTGAVPPVSLTATPEWYALSPNARLPLMCSVYTSQSLLTTTHYEVAVTPFVEWFDSWGNFITRIYARTPTAGTPGIPDQLAFDSFTRSPGPSIAARLFDNGYAGSWTAQDSDFTVTGYKGGVAYPVTAGTRAMALVTGAANGQVGVTFVTAATGGQAQGIVFRFSDENNYWKATTTALVKKVAGVFSTVATYSTAAQLSDRLVVQMNGSAITVLLNGTSVATATDTFNSTAVKHGMICE